MDNFWKLFFTLFGIGAAVSFAKSMKSKKPLKEVLSEMIVTGIFSVSAATVYLFVPEASMIAVAGLGSLLTILGIAFFSKKVEEYLDKAADKYLKKD